MSKYFNRIGFLLFLYLPFFNPLALKYIPGFVVLYNVAQVWKLTAIGIVIFIYIFRGRFTIPVLLVLLFESLSVVTSLMNGVYDNRVFTNFFLIVGISMLIELSIVNNIDKTIQVLTGIMLTISTINCILCILYPSGLKMASLYTNWANPLYLIALDNGMIKQLLPMLVLVYYSRFGKNVVMPKKIVRQRTIIFIFANLISLITLIIVKSAAGLAVYVIFCALVMGYSLITGKRYPYRLMILVYILFFVGVIWLGTDSGFLTGITTLLGRSSTFSGRTSLWYNAVNLIMNRPWIGYGYTAGNISIWGGNYSSHNMFLELIIQGGVIYFAVFLYFMFYAFLRVRKASVQFSNLFFAALFCFMLDGLVETGVGYELFMIVIMMCYPDFNSNVKNIHLRIR